MLIILDNGHGMDTKGKRSPVWSDGSQLIEAEFNRDIVNRIARKLNMLAVPYAILVSELNDVPLEERCRRANMWHEAYDHDSVLISVHANAGGGKGWEVFTSPGETKADEIATIIAEQAKAEFEPDGFKMRFDHTDGDPDKEADFYILKHTKCPAVLTENFFYDNEAECRFLMSEEGRERIANMHVKSILKIIEK